jgi:hypothetical protein
MFTLSGRGEPSSTITIPDKKMGLGGAAAGVVGVLDGELRGDDVVDELVLVPVEVEVVVPLVEVPVEVEDF